MTGLLIDRVELSEEAVSRIFETAIDAGHTYGFGYWARLEKIRDDERGQIYKIRLREREASQGRRRPRTFTLEGADLERGIAAYLTDGAGHPVMITDDNLDGPLAETLIQYACFGQQVYG